MIYITGDTHSEFNKFNMDSFPEQKEMTRDDYVIICGDFGGVWNVERESSYERYWLKWLEDKTYTTLFVDGNHENYDRLLHDYPEYEWNGGVVHEIRPHVIHLCRGYVFEINGTKIFTFGGARSHDIQGGILDVTDPEIYKKKHNLERQQINYRVNHISWWKEEMPNEIEMKRGLVNLQKHNNEVDFIVTHDGPSSVVALVGHGLYEVDELNKYLEEIRINSRYKRWFMGHMHLDKAVNASDIILYDQIVRIA